jgi:hypothetical protein
MFIDNNRPNQPPFENKKLRVMNRGGSTALKVGDVMALDLDASASETQNKKGVGGDVTTLLEAMFANIVEVGASPVNGICVVVTSLLSGGGEDNTEVEVQVSGPVKAKVGGTNWSSSLASAGVRVMADTTGANRRLIAATDGTNHVVGAIAEDIATDLSGSDQQETEVLLFGWGNLVGSLGA